MSVKDLASFFFQPYTKFKKENKAVTYNKTLIMIGGTLVSFLFGAWHVSLTILLAFMMIDYITGVLKGAYQGKLRSMVGFKGGIKKAGMLFVVIMGHLLDVLVSNGVPVFRTMAVFFIIGTEGISILENLGAIGVKVPKGIAKYIEQLSKEEGNQPKK